MQKIATPFPGLYLLKPRVFRDARGFFMETFNQAVFQTLELETIRFVQDNLSQSQYGTIRGMHFQAPPHAQAKLVTTFEGSVLDAVVDIRKGSPTYGQYFSVVLDAADPTFFYIPVGFAHGFQVLSEKCLFYYKCSDVYAPQADGAIAWNDPDVGINWHDIPPVLSDKDQKASLLKNYDSPFVFQG